jgi:hypothetical protein
MIPPIGHQGKPLGLGLYPRGHTRRKVRPRRVFAPAHLQRVCLKIRSAWANTNQNQYAVTTIRMVEKTNFEKRSCVIGGNSKMDWLQENKAAERNMIARRLRHARSGCEGQYPVRYA